MSIEIYSEEVKQKVKELLCHHERTGTDSDNYDCIKCGKYIIMSWNKNNDSK